MTRKIARYGWRPDLPDHRDLAYAPPAPASLPTSVDLRPQCPPVYDQGQLGSCTGNAIAGLMQFVRKKEGLPYADRVPSRLFIYYNERSMEGTVPQDAGAEIRDGMKAVATLGACFEDDPTAPWPYDVSRFTDEPPTACYNAAQLDEALQYQRLIHTRSMMQACLADGFPFVFGFTVYESFETTQVADTGVVPMPTQDQGVVGGHAVVAVGYDDAKAAFLVRNSWGAGWGLGGYFWLPYDYVTNNQLASDFWTIRLI